MSEIMWLIKFKDGTIIPWRSKRPIKSHFQDETELYVINPNTKIVEISDWVAYGYTECSNIKKVENSLSRLPILVFIKPISYFFPNFFVLLSNCFNILNSFD